MEGSKLDQEELKSICFLHQFDVIIVFPFYLRMSDKP
jgi:hypothetical protein